MEALKKVMYYILHTFDCCKDEDMDKKYGIMLICKKCGRTYYLYR